MAGIFKLTLNWNQDILEPQKQVWKLVAGDALAMPQHNVKSVVKPIMKPTPVEIASCGRGRGRTISEKLRELSTMSLAASSQYSGETDSRKKKPVARKPTFLTREEQEAKKRFEERKNKVINHKEESIRERYTSLGRQASQYTQEI